MSVTVTSETLRLVRDDMDNLLRRYHGYAVKENIGAHYREIGADADSDFEHLIPSARIRDMMIAGVITIDEALKGREPWNVSIVKGALSDNVVIG